MCAIVMTVTHCRWLDILLHVQPDLHAQLDMFTSLSCVTNTMANQDLSQASCQQGVMQQKEERLIFS